MGRRIQRSPRPRPRARRSGRSETPEAILDAAVTAIVSSIQRDSAGLATAADPLEAELFVSRILPLRWSPIAVEILLGDWLPRKALLEPDEIEIVPEILRRFVRYAARRKGLAERVFGETLEAIDRFAPDFGEGMADDGRAGPAKQLARDLRASGIDLADDSAVQRWIDEREEGLRNRRS